MVGGRIAEGIIRSKACMTSMSLPDLPHSPDNGSPPAYNNNVVHTKRPLPLVEQSPAQCGLLHLPS